MVVLLPAIFLNADLCESVDFREKESFLTSLRPAFMIILGCVLGFDGLAGGHGLR